MSIFASEQDAAELRAAYEEAIADALFRAPPPSAAMLERAALMAMPPVVHPAVPVECARMFVDVLERDGTDLAAAALEVYARVASGPLAEAAAGAVARLDVDGVSFPCADEIGAIDVVSVSRGEMPQNSAFYLLGLRRPHRGRTQLGLVFVGPDACGEEVVGGLMVTPEMTLEHFRERERSMLGGFPSRPSSADEALEHLTRALAHMVEHEHALPEWMLADLVLLDVILTGRPGTLPRPLLRDLTDPEMQVRAQLAREMQDDGVDACDPEAAQRWLDGRAAEAADELRRRERHSRRRPPRRR